MEFFDRMDRDYDGKLSFQEFMGEETPLERLFTSMDKDGDGTVTKEVINICFINMIKCYFIWHSTVYSIISLIKMPSYNHGHIGSNQLNQNDEPKMFFKGEVA